ncbi:hypothetical protein TRICI_005591 [Trichomonascus ciferrii]|uniref:Uncharacterized protein n=1 Tax=Trichomonascus ciferrii TaxID=44093 RepID=A0A642URN0_9ASCO|nr:hypothetical protein TRICI_005591 [Trichomonascus ciferrii]
MDFGISTNLTLKNEMLNEELRKASKENEDLTKEKEHLNKEKKDLSEEKEDLSKKFEERNVDNEEHKRKTKELEAKTDELEKKREQLAALVKKKADLKLESEEKDATIDKSRSDAGLLNNDSDKEGADEYSLHGKRIWSSYLVF